MGTCIPEWPLLCLQSKQHPHIITHRPTQKMADVEMTDAGASAGKSAAPKMKSSKAGASTDAGEKKRFEVKKVHLLFPHKVRIQQLTTA